MTHAGQPRDPVSPNTTSPSATAESGHSGLRRFARQLSLPGFGPEAQDKLARASILCLGAGGLGCPALLHLAAAGVGHLVIVDDDVVSLTNLQRQILFTEADTGQPKAATAAARLKALHSSLRVTVVHDRFRAANAMDLSQGCDLILDGTDNFSTRYLSSDVATWRRIPNVYGAVHRFEGQLSVFHPAAGGPCYRCMFPTPPPPGTVPSCAEAGILGTVTGLIGTLQASEAIKLLTGLGQPLIGRLFHFDSLSMASRTLTLRRDPACPVCGPNPSITSPLDSEFSCALPTPAPPPPSLNAAEFATLIANPDTVVLDVREPWESALLPFPQASLTIPAALIEARLSEIPHSQHPIIAVCSIGQRSALAAATLRSLGFPTATHLANGLDALP